RSIMRLLPALLLVLTLTATGAPLPFPRAHSTWKPLQGEWAILALEGDGFIEIACHSSLPELAAVVRGERVRLYLDGGLAGEWAVPSGVGRGGGLIYRLAPAARGSEDRRAVHVGGLLKLSLGSRDIGFTRWSRFTGRDESRVGWSSGARPPDHPGRG